MILKFKNDIAVITLGRLTSAVISLISIRAVTTFLTPAQYGELAILLTVQMFCGLLLVNPIGQHINLNTHKWWDDGSLITRMCSYKKYVFAVSIFGALFYFTMNSQQQDGSLLLASGALFAIIVTTTWNSTLIPMLNMLGFRASSILWTIISGAVCLISSVIIVMWLPLAAAWLIGQAIGMGVGAFGSKYVLTSYDLNAKNDSSINKNKKLIDRETIIKYCLPLGLATSLMWVQQSGYRLLIDAYWGLEELGFLAVGLQVAGQIWGLAESLVVQFFYPYFYRRINENNDTNEINQAYSDLLNVLAPIYLILAGIFTFFSPILINILISNKFNEAIGFLIFGIFIEMLRVQANLFGCAAQITRKTKSLILPYGIGAFFSLTLILFSGVKQLNITATGFCLVAGSALMLVSMVIIMYREIKFSINPSRLFAAGLAMLGLLSFSFLLPSMQSIQEHAGIAILIALFSVWLAYIMLWKCESTKRLMSVELKAN